MEVAPLDSPESNKFYYGPVKILRETVEPPPSARKRKPYSLAGKLVAKIQDLFLDKNEQDNNDMDSLNFKPPGKDEEEAVVNPYKTLSQGNKVMRIAGIVFLVAFVLIVVILSVNHFSTASRKAKSPGGKMTGRAKARAKARAKNKKPVKKPVKKVPAVIPVEKPVKKPTDTPTVVIETTPVETTEETPIKPTETEIIVNDRLAICPVCKTEFKRDMAEFEHYLKAVDKTYYFDREKCYRTFLSDPNGYAGIRIKVKIKVDPDYREVPDNVITDIPLDPATETPPPHVPQEMNTPVPNYQPQPHQLPPDTYNEPLPPATQTPDLPVEIVPDGGSDVNVPIEDIPLEDGSVSEPSIEATNIPPPGGSMNTHPPAAAKPTSSTSQPATNSEIHLPPGLVPPQGEVPPASKPGVGSAHKTPLPPIALPPGAMPPKRKKPTATPSPSPAK